MKVKELIEALQGLDSGAEVVLSRDGEGNGFSPLYQVGEDLYAPTSPWSGELYDEEDAPEDATLAIVLWPAN